MLPMLKNRNKASTIIIRKMKGSDDYGKLKDYNEMEGPEKMMTIQKPIKDFSQGMDQCCQDMLTAIEQKDPKMLKMSMKKMFKMLEEEEDQEEELEESSEI